MPQSIIPLVILGESKMIASHVRAADDCVEINREMGIMRGKRVAYRATRLQWGVPRLNRSPWNAATVAHTEGGRFITPRERTVWISVRAWRRREGRSGIPDASARARARTRMSTSLSPNECRGCWTPRRAARVPIGSFLCGVHCAIFFFLSFFRSGIFDLLELQGKLRDSEWLCNFKSRFLR